MRVPAPLAPAVLDALAGRSGAVVEDTVDRLYTWFVPPGAAAPWPPLHGVAVLSRGSTAVLVPPAGQRWGALRWLVLPEPDGPWTDPDALGQALTVGLATTVGPRRPVTAPCPGCGRQTAAGALVPAMPGPDADAWACTACAPTPHGRAVTP
ncbi:MULTISPECIES: hypothetical protein [Streptomyces]|uniref:hypothetical protein n=1 Tax=Streptomyces TaxID=1883 RepID=UPI002249971A|nr:hypothetical protein [Streptomyces sp. JHD 1]MCX2967278.1 hypothetical protein [Streptomyces sp. JHD 1]